jgi:hypothetical protein
MATTGVEDLSIDGRTSGGTGAPRTAITSTESRLSKGGNFGCVGEMIVLEMTEYAPKSGVGIRP